ncbi:MAG TPA: hypothetical protein VGM91_10305 [Conexibacter sp.]|jgi:hypothetical protein
MDVLFSLGEYDRAAWLTFRTLVETALPRIEPGLATFDVHEVEKVPTARVVIDKEREVSIPPMRVEQTISLEPRRVVSGDLGAVRESLLEVAEREARLRMRWMAHALDAITAATGQVQRTSGPMSWESVMDGLANVRVGFDERGEPKFSIWPPRAQQEYDALPPRTDEQQARWQSLMDEKRMEDNARKRDRRLR